MLLSAGKVVSVKSDEMYNELESTGE